MAAAVLAGKADSRRAAAVRATMPGRPVGEHRGPALHREDTDIARAEAVRPSRRVQANTICRWVNGQAAFLRLRRGWNEPARDSAFEQGRDAGAGEVAANDVLRGCLEVAARSRDCACRRCNRGREQRDNDDTHSTIVFEPCHTPSVFAEVGGLSRPIAPLPGEPFLFVRSDTNPELKAAFPGLVHSIVGQRG